MDAIIASDLQWNSSKDKNGNVTAYGKPDKIRHVYERYLYNEFKEDFDAYAVVRRTYKKDDVEMEIENDRLGGFYQFEEPHSPTDLKNHPISEALDKTDGAGYIFSIWAREWEPDMRADYMGNYIYGYNGAEYFQGFDFDKYWKTAAVSAVHNPILSSGLLTYESAITGLRKLNPDKTDAELLCLMGAGGAQLIDNKDLLELLQGNWGDNAGDSDYMSEGFNDYYKLKGIDKAKMIEKER